MIGINTKEEEGIIEQLKEVLIRQVGNNRECPKCRHSFIPKDSTTQAAWEMYKILFGAKKTFTSTNDVTDITENKGDSDG